MAENRLLAGKHLGDSRKSLDKAAALLASDNVSPATAADLAEAARLLERAKTREKLRQRETTFAL